MEVINSITALQNILNIEKEKGSIGFVPTMGALHEGHLSLVRQSAKENHVTVVSIYVNPTQFNDKKDLERYPRDLNSDIDLLKSTGCNYIFAPTDNEMYPEEDNRVFDFGLLETVMEGKHRPGHFNGVGQIVSKLFDAVKPDKSYFGLKDFQQLAVIKKLVKDYNYNIEIIPHPIVRESDGLAMSSRNTLLTKEHREVSPLIYKTLLEVKNRSKQETVPALIKYVTSVFEINKLLKLEYFEIVDDETLQPIKTLTSDIKSTACIAIHAGKIRLIDNIQLNS